jgi:hypothetical protein
MNGVQKNQLNIVVKIIHGFASSDEIMIIGEIWSIPVAAQSKV